MGVESLNLYVWGNLTQLKSIFDKKAYFVLLKYKEEGNKVDFMNTLEVLLNISEGLLFKIKNYNDSELEHRIHSIKIDRFKQYVNSFSMSFSKNINIIIGDNSVGKTSLLQAITLGILKNNYLGELNDYEKYITTGFETAEVEIDFGGYYKRVIFYKNKREVLGSTSPFILAYGSSIFTKYNLNVDEIVNKIIDKQVVRNFTDSIFIDYIDTFYNPKLILNELSKRKNKRARYIEDIMKKTINYFIDDFELVKNKGIYTFQSNNNQNFKLNQLSEGFRNNILLISDILIRIFGSGYTPENVRGIILIDEFDRHLHPKWQSNVISKLKIIFPNIQFILTTHNPMSILDREADEITKLLKTEEGILALRGKGTKNIDVSIVLLEYFNVTSTVGNSMQKHINNFNKLKIKKELTEIEINELRDLEDFLGNTIASNFIYDRKYLKFLEYIKTHKEIDFDKYEKINEEEMKNLLEDFGEFFND